jgi:hypothetical protein
MIRISKTQVPIVRSTGRRLERKYLPAIAAFNLLFLLFLFITPAEYVNCQHIYPDECLDLFGLCEDVTVNAEFEVSPLKSGSSALPAFYEPDWYASHVGANIDRSFLIPSFQSRSAELLLITVLRC